MFLLKVHIILIMFHFKRRTEKEQIQKIESCALAEQPKEEPPRPDDTTCVICGSVIPEGRHVCSACELEITGGPTRR